MNWLGMAKVGHILIVVGLLYATHHLLGAPVEVSLWYIDLGVGLLIWAVATYRLSREVPNVVLLKRKNGRWIAAPVKIHDGVAYCMLSDGTSVDYSSLVNPKRLSVAVECYTC